MSESWSGLRTCLWLALVLLFLPAGTRSQVCQESLLTWGGNADDWAFWLDTDAKGNFYLQGGTSSFGAGKTDTLLLSYDSQRQFRWARTWGGAGIDATEAMALDDGPAGGRIYLSGCTDCYPGKEDALLMMYDFGGVLKWVSSWSSKGGGSEHADAVFLDSKKSVYLVGGIRGALEDVLLMKYSRPTSNGPGTPVVKAWGAAGFESANGGCAYLPKAGPECVYVVGNSTSYSTAGMDVLVQKYDTGLNLVWSRTWGRDRIDDDAWAITVDARGNVYVGGVTGPINGAGDALLLSWDPNGKLRWTATWTGPGAGAEEVGCLLLDAARRELYVTGGTTSFSSSKTDGLLLKFSTSTGQCRWSMIWGNRRQDDFLVGLGSQGGNIYVAGAAGSKAGTLQRVKGTVLHPASPIKVQTQQSVPRSGSVAVLRGTRTAQPNRTGLSMEVAFLKLKVSAASYSTFGAGCPGRNGTPKLSAAPGRLPKLGQTFSVGLAQARQGAAACLILGGSKLRWGPIKLPLDLTGALAPGCSLLVSVDLLLCFVVDSAGRGSVPLPIPADAALCGVEFHNQFLVFDAAANRLGLAWSNGGSAKAGH